MSDKLEEWADSVDGRWVDLDSAPMSAPYQCHDLFLSYGYMLGMEPGDGHAPGVDGWTSEVWRQYPRHRPGLRKVFTKHSARNIRRGDVVFWWSYAGVGGLAHVAIALEEARNGEVLCMTQNPGRAGRARLTLTGVLGVLRPIPKEVPDMTPAESKMLREVHAMLKALPGKVADAVLDEPVGRHGTAKPERTTLRTLVAKGETLLRRAIAHASNDTEGRTIPLNPDIPKMPK